MGVVQVENKETDEIIERCNLRLLRDVRYENMQSTIKSLLDYIEAQEEFHMMMEDMESQSHV